MQFSCKAPPQIEPRTNYLEVRCEPSLGNNSFSFGWLHVLPLIPGKCCNQLVLKNVTWLPRPFYHSNTWFSSPLYSLQRLLEALALQQPDDPRAFLIDELARLQHPDTVPPPCRVVSNLSCFSSPLFSFQFFQPVYQKRRISGKLLIPRAWNRFHLYTQCVFFYTAGFFVGQAPSPSFWKICHRWWNFFSKKITSTSLISFVSCVSNSAKKQKRHNERGKRRKDELNLEHSTADFTLTIHNSLSKTPAQKKNTFVPETHTSYFPPIFLWREGFPPRLFSVVASLRWCLELGPPIRLRFPSPAES